MVLLEAIQQVLQEVVVVVAVLELLVLMPTLE
jgi:hypothetical protein